MTRIILIYANCVNPTAKGDFALAGNIAKELMDEIKNSNESIDVILTSTPDNTYRYEQLYGAAINGRLNIEGRYVGLCPIDQSYLIQNEIVAFIEANRCAFPPEKLLKQVLSPNSKILFIGAANKPVLTRDQQTWMLEQHYPQQQAGIYHYFHRDDKLICPTGIGADRLGLNSINKIYSLPQLAPAEREKIPAKDYGFIYLANDPIPARKIIAQYIKLTAFDKYSLVGDFKPDDTPKILAAYTAEKTEIKKLSTALPQLDLHPSLSNKLMRTMCTKAAGNLVASTGVMSALEAMQDGKLTFYQDLDNNVKFVTSYLQAVQATTNNPDHNELARLLFAAKPLSPRQMERIAQLLSMPNIGEELIEINRLIIKQSTGATGIKILNFISAPCHTKPQTQLAQVCHFLKTPGESNPASLDTAVRRAAAKGHLFELKVLIKYLSRSDISKQDNTEKQFTALHWAIHCSQNDSALLLIASEMELNIQDKQGLTPLHHAVITSNKMLINRLLQKGAVIILDNFLDKEELTPEPANVPEDEMPDDSSDSNSNTSSLCHARLFTPKPVINYTDSQDDIYHHDAVVDNSGSEDTPVNQENHAYMRFCCNIS